MYVCAILPPQDLPSLPLPGCYSQSSEGLCLCLPLPLPCGQLVKNCFAEFLEREGGGRERQHILERGRGERKTTHARERGGGRWGGREVGRGRQHMLERGGEGGREVGR